MPDNDTSPAANGAAPIKWHPAALVPEQIAAASAVRDSGGSQTPKAVLHAFAPDVLSAAGMEFQPITMSTILLLQKVDNSLLKKDAGFSVEDILNALYIVSHDIRAVRALLAQRGPSGGRQAFEDAVFEMAIAIPARAIGVIGEALNQALTDAFATLVPHGINKGSNPDSPFPAAPTPGPDSAGS